MKKRLLLLSNSTNPGEQYLGWTESYIKSFFGDEIKRLLFIPYAGITISYEDYTNQVRERLGSMGYQVTGIHQDSAIPQGFEDYDAIVVGGGNTFQLANLLQKNNLIGPIRKAVENGMPFLGWSAGSNIACPTIMTTNDMPVVEPASFKGLNLIPFQINPHYTDKSIQGHGGETREMRLREFLKVNPENIVAGLPEGSLIQIEEDNAQFMGKGPLRIFKRNEEVRLIEGTKDVSKELL
jgi:dipeptidase E